jgi:hypothetical protein
MEFEEFVHALLDQGEQTVNHQMGEQRNLIKLHIIQHLADAILDLTSLASIVALVKPGQAWSALLHTLEEIVSRKIPTTLMLPYSTLYCIS